MKTLKKLFGFSLGPLVGMIISMITVPVTTYYIIPGETGKAAIFTTTRSVLLLFIYLGMDNSFIREYHDAKNKKSLLANCLILPAIVDLILVILSPIIAVPLSNWMFGEVHKDVIILFGISLFTVTLSRFIYISIRMEEKAVLYSSLHIASQLLILLLTIFYIIFVRRDFLTIVYSNLIGQISFDVLLAFVFRDKISFNFRDISLSKIRGLLKYGLPLAGVAIVGYLLNSIDTYFLKAYSSYEEIGYYTIAAKITGFLSVIQNAFGSFWIPISYRWYSEQQPVEKYEKAGRFLTLIMSIVFMGIMLFRDLIPVIISRDYINALPIIPFLLFYPIMYTLGITTELGIQFKKKTNYSLIISIVALLINTILNFSLVPILGGRGAAITTGVSYMVFFWLKTVKSRSLWVKFSVQYLIITNIILVICAVINTFVVNTSVLYLCNTLGMVIILFIFRHEIMFGYQFLKTQVIQRRIRELR